MSQVVSAGSQTIVIRSWRSSALWFAVAALPLATAVFNKPEMTNQGRFLIGLFALFGAQAFASELLGTRLETDSVSFPRRLFPYLPLIVWRRRIPLKQISRADSLGDRGVRLYVASAELVDFMLPDSESKWRFLRYLGKAKAARQPIRKQR